MTSTLGSFVPLQKPLTLAFKKAQESAALQSESQEALSKTKKPKTSKTQPATVKKAPQRKKPATETTQEDQPLPWE